MSMKNTPGARQAQLDLGGEVALEQGDHGQHGQPGAQSDDHAAPGARAVQVGSAMRMGALPRRPTSRTPRRTRSARPTSRTAAASATPTKIAPRRRSATPATASAPSAARLGQSRPGGRRRQPPRRHQQRAKHAGRRHLAGARERPDGEQERGQQPAGRRGQRQRVEITVSRIGDSRPTTVASNQGTRCPTTRPAAMPIPASAGTGADTCGRSADCAPRGI